MRPSRTASLAASFLLLGSLATASGCAPPEPEEDEAQSEDELRKTNDPFDPASCGGTARLNVYRFHDAHTTGSFVSPEFPDAASLALLSTFWEAIDKRTCTTAPGRTPAFTCTEWKQHTRTEGYERENPYNPSDGRYAKFGFSLDGERAFVAGENLSATCSLAGTTIECTSNMRKDTSQHSTRATGDLHRKCVRLATASSFEKRLSPTTWEEYRAALLIRF